MFILGTQVRYAVSVLVTHNVCKLQRFGLYLTEKYTKGMLHISDVVGGASMQQVVNSTFPSRRILRLFKGNVVILSTQDQTCDF